jgi:hypothetical protein
MLKAITTVAAGMLLALSSQPLMAVGFGRLVNSTTLGQSLDVSVALSADVTEQITPNCVGADVVVGESVLPHPAVRVRLEPAGSSGTQSLRITTTVRILEPVVSVTVSVACPSRVSRQFVVFVDPPLTAFESSVPVAVEPPATVAIPASPVAAASAVPSGVASETVITSGDLAVASSGSATPLAAAAPPVRPTANPSESMETSAQAPIVRRSKANARKARRTPLPVPRARSVPRLELERGSTAVAVAAVAPAASAAASAATPMPAAVAASATEPTEAERAAEAQRAAIQSLQQRLDRLQAESETSRKSIVQLQARLQQAEASGSTAWWSYALAAVGAALLLWLGLLIGRRAAAPRAGAPWWNADAVPESAAATAVRAPKFVPSALSGLPEAIEIPADMPLDAPMSPVMTEPPSPAPESLRPAHGFGDTVASVGSPPLGSSATSILASGLKADELIDLEQQAEFFVALGQDDSAVDLLDAFVRGNGGASRLPYLKLLEIHRRRGDREAYERVRALHERGVGSPAPGWADGPLAEAAIEDDAPLMRRIEAVWADPSEAMRQIESLLVGDERAARPFDLQTYADLVFLYLLARALREVDEPATAPSVDLLLPLPHQHEPRSVVTAASRSTPDAAAGNRSVDAVDSTPSEIDLELDFLPPRTDPKPLV